MIKQTSDQLRDEILGEMIVGFNRLEEVLESLSMYYLEMYFVSNNFIKDMLTMTELRNLKGMKISRKRKAMKVARLMKRKSKVTKLIDPRKEIGPMKAITKKRRKLKCNEKE